MHFHRGVGSVCCVFGVFAIRYQYACLSRVSTITIELYRRIGVQVDAEVKGVLGIAGGVVEAKTLAPFAPVISAAMAVVILVEVAGHELQVAVFDETLAFGLTG